MPDKISRSARYVARLVLSRDRGPQTFDVEGSMLFADVSGFTALSERLAEQGRAGAEELTEILNGTFTDLLTVAFAEGGDLLKYGGDALLLLFTGEHHAERACRAAFGMRRALRERGAIATGRGKVTLKVSQGIHSGVFSCFLAGGDQRELIIAGRAATTVTDMETAADAGDILVSHDTAARLRPTRLGATKGPGVLLKRSPDADPVPPPVAIAADGEPPERFLAPAIRTRIEAGVREAEHRHVTVGFVHVFGLDDLIDSVGAGEVLERLDRLVRVASRRADDAGVCLIATDIAGDGTKLILTAGAPDAIEDGAGNMLSVVRAVLDEIDDLGMHAGVCAGHVFAGEVGAPFRAVYTVIGDTVNLSARLMSKAGPRELYAHTPTVEQSDVVFQTEILEPFFVKGKSRPIEAMAIGDRLGIRERTNALDVGFVGRRAELDLLGDLLASAKDGRGACVSITADAGVGKSRLVDAFTQSADVVSTRLTGESFQAEQAYFMTRLVLRRVLGIDPREDPLVAGEELRRVVEQAAPDLLPYLPLLGLAAAADVPATDTVDQIIPENVADVLADVIERLLRALLDQTYILVIENSEWMDDASVNVFSRLLRRIGTTPWLVVLTNRGTPTGLHPDSSFAATTIELSAMSDDDIVELARTAFGETAVPHHEIEEICRRSAGNPLYLLELVNARLSVGSLEEIPTSLEDIVTSRIDRLDPYDRRVLRYASVLGSRFPPRLAELVFETDVPDVAEQELWDRLGEFLVVERGGDLRFAHELLRDVAYAGLPFERRRELHERVGLALESTGGGVSDDRLSMLSLHFDRAGDRPRAWRYSRRAATRAQEQYANLEAATFLERAIEHGRVAGVAPGAELADAAEELGDVCSVIGQFERSSWAYSLARSLRHDDPDHVPRLLRKQGVVRVRSGRYRAALGWYRRAMHAAEHVDDERRRASEEAELAVAYAGVRYRQGKVAECARWGRDAVELAQRGGNRRAEAHAYYLLDAALTDLGDPSAVEVRGLALPIFEELGDLHGQSNVLNNLGVDALQEGDWDEAADFWTRCRSVRLRAGDIVGLGDIAYNLGEMRSDQGRFEQAADLLRDARRTFQAAEYPLGVAASVNGLGRLFVRLGDVDDGLRRFHEALDMFTALDSTVWMWEVEVRIGEALAYGGRFAEAVEHTERLLDEHDLGPAPNLHSTARRALGLARAGLGDRERAVHELALARDIARDGNSQFDVALSAFERARLVDDPAEAAGDRELAESIFERLDVEASRVVAPSAVTSAAGH